MTAFKYDAIVIGGSASGLSATLAIARALVSVVCVDAGKPCNRFSKESHNFLTHDNESPSSIKRVAREQVEKYPNASFIDDEVVSIIRQDDKETFTVRTKGNPDVLNARNIIIATGMNDNIEASNVKNLGQFWGNSIFTCGYCHGFEYAGKQAGLYASNEMFLKVMVPIVYNWNKNLTVFGSQTAIDQLSENKEMSKRGINTISHSPIAEIVGDETQIESIILENGDKIDLDVLYYVPNSVINMRDLITRLGIELDGMGFIKVDKQSQMTNIPGIYAAGDCTTMMRSLAVATQTGQLAGASLTHKLFGQHWTSF